MFENLKPRKDDATPDRFVSTRFKIDDDGLTILDTQSNDDIVIAKAKSIRHAQEVSFALNLAESLNIDNPQFQAELGGFKIDERKSLPDSSTTVPEALTHLRKMLSGYEQSLERLETMTDVEVKDMPQHADVLDYARKSWNALALAIMVLETVPLETMLKPKADS